MKTANGIALILILAVSSMLWVESTAAQSMLKPSVPEFTVKETDQSYDIAPSASTNPYTGEPTTTPGYHVSKHNIVVTIKNQPYTPTLVNANTTGVFYNVEAKSNKPHYTSGFESRNLYAIKASNDDYTTVTINFDNGENGAWEISRGIQVDFRVQAVVGYSYLVQGIHILPEGNEFVLLSAGNWSNPQTIVIGDGNTTTEPANALASSTPAETETPTQMSTSTPSQAVTQTDVALGLSWEQLVIAVMAVVIAVMAIVIVFLRRRGK